jgi:hypothetical protein
MRVTIQHIRNLPPILVRLANPRDGARGFVAIGLGFTSCHLEGSSIFLKVFILIFWQKEREVCHKAKTAPIRNRNIDTGHNLLNLKKYLSQFPL